MVQRCSRHGGAGAYRKGEVPATRRSPHKRGPCKRPPDRASGFERGAGSVGDAGLVPRYELGSCDDAECGGEASGESCSDGHSRTLLCAIFSLTPPHSLNLLAVCCKRLCGH